MLSLALQREWEREQKKSQPSLPRAFARAFIVDITLLNIYLAAECVVQLVSPYMLGQIIFGLQTGASSSRLYLYALGLSLSILVYEGD